MGEGWLEVARNTWITIRWTENGGKNEKKYYKRIFLSFLDCYRSIVLESLKISITRTWKLGSFRREKRIVKGRRLLIKLKNYIIMK